MEYRIKHQIIYTFFPSDSFNSFFFKKFLLDIFFIYISNVIPKFPYILPLPCSPASHPSFLTLALAIPWEDVIHKKGSENHRESQKP